MLVSKLLRTYTKQDPPRIGIQDVESRLMVYAAVMQCATDNHLPLPRYSQCPTNPSETIKWSSSFKYRVLLHSHYLDKIDNLFDQINIGPSLYPAGKDHTDTYEQFVPHHSGASTERKLPFDFLIAILYTFWPLVCLCHQPY